MTPTTRRYLPLRLTSPIILFVAGALMTLLVAINRSVTMRTTEMTIQGDHQRTGINQYRMGTIRDTSTDPIVPTASPSSPEPTVRPDTGAFKSCHHDNQRIEVHSVQDQSESQKQGVIPRLSSDFFFPEFHDGTVTVACRTIHFRLPRYLQTYHTFRLTETRQKLKIVIGILSGNSKAHAEKRKAVRQTWAKDLVNLYFIVAGPWTDSLAKEHRIKQDILWLDIPEHYEDLFYKTSAFFAIIQKHVRGYTHVLKTDDDTYVNLPELKEELWRNGEGWEKDYFGHCHEKRTTPYRPAHRKRLPEYFLKFIVNKTIYPEKWHPPYCQGAGFLVRPSFVNCMAEHLPHIRYHPFEDVGVGLLAERCGVAATRHSDANEYKWVFDYRPANLTGKILQHPVETPDAMRQTHQTVIKTLTWQ